MIVFENYIRIRYTNKQKLSFQIDFLANETTVLSATVE